MDKIVGIGELAISDNKNDIIKTFALASCVAVTVYCSKKNAAGMVHIALPSPSPSGNNGRTRSTYYAKTGVPLLINRMCAEFGCSKHELEIRLYGGADSIRNDDVFNIGRRNIEAVKKVLSSLNLKYHTAEVGGIISRTLEMDVASGKIKIFTQPLNI